MSSNVLWSLPGTVLGKHHVNGVPFLSAPPLDSSRMGNPAGVVQICVLGSQHVGAAVCLTSP